MRQKIVAGNWKMNNDYQEGMTLFSEIVNMIKDEVNSETEVIVACPYIHLHSFGQMANGRIRLAAQNCHQEEKGAYTGEVRSEQHTSELQSLMSTSYAVFG